MDRERLDRWCERAILGLVLAILVFGPLATGAVRPGDFLVLQALTVLATGFWVARFWINRRHRIQWTPICWVVVAWVIYALWRYHQADIEVVARRELIRIVTYALLFFIVLNNLHRQETTQALHYVVLFLGMAISIYAIYQFITNSDHVWGFVRPAAYKGRGSGTYICPNHLAGFLEVLLPMALACVFLGRSGYVMRVVYGYIAFVLLSGIAVTVSRGSYVCVGVALLVFFGLLVRYPSYRRAALVALLAIALGAYVFVQKAYQPQKRFSRMYIPGQLEEATVRPNLWVAATRMWRDNFWLGVGPGHFDYRFRAYRPVSVQARPFWAHNDYANTLADWGLVGGVIVGAALVCLYAGVFKTWRFVHRAHNDLVTKRSDRAAHVYGVAFGLLTLLFHSFLDFNMQIPANAILVIVLMANLTSHLRFATDNYWVTPHWVGRVLATAVGVIAIAYLGGQAQRRYREVRLLGHAEKAKTLTEQMAILKRALAVEPMNGDTAYMIGEANRLLSWEGGEDYRALAVEALRWFDLGMRLNPWETFNLLRYGMCLDWLGKHAQAAVFFKQAYALDPNSYYVIALQGWHQLQNRDLLAAKGWFERSLKIKWYSNEIATSYLAIIDRRLKEMEAEPHPANP